MFTGIVEELGTLAGRRDSRLRFEAREVLADVTLGASISVNGCCLTVVDFDLPPDQSQSGWWEADLADETFARTSFGSVELGEPVNMERPVRLADRLGGHLVQGHVDGVGIVGSPAPDLAVTMDPALSRYVVEKGSITVDGVSLTVVKALSDGFTVAIIPHTAQVTTLGIRQVGDPVNLEVDVMAKYAERLMAWHRDTDIRDSTGNDGQDEADAPEWSTQSDYEESDR